MIKRMIEVRLDDDGSWVGWETYYPLTVGTPFLREGWPLVHLLESLSRDVMQTLLTSAAGKGEDAS